jgi:hypothetical protein
MLDISRNTINKGCEHIPRPVPRIFYAVCCLPPTTIANRQRCRRLERSIADKTSDNNVDALDRHVLLCVCDRLRFHRSDTAYHRTWLRFRRDARRITATACLDQKLRNKTILDFALVCGWLVGWLVWWLRLLELSTCILLLRIMRNLLRLPAILRPTCCLQLRTPRPCNIALRLLQSPRSCEYLRG